MISAAFQVEVFESFMALSQALATLCEAVETEALLAWTQSPDPNPNQHRQRACAILKQLEYTNTQAPRETILCAGFIGASENTLKLAQWVNQCKDRFKKSILALKGANISKTDPYLTEKFNTVLDRATPTSYTLQKLGLARLHLKQCYRKIPILEKAPTKISWTWAHTRAIKKITVAKAQEILLKKTKMPSIEMQLQKLQTLSLKESLAIVQDLAPHLRANLVFKEGDSLQRQMIKAPIPLFFPCDSLTPRPTFTPPLPKQDKDNTRGKRSDVKIDPVVFIPAIRAHRYLT